MIDATDIESQVSLKRAMNMDDFEANFYSKNKKTFEKIEQDLIEGRRSKVRFMRKLKLSFLKLGLFCLAIEVLFIVYWPVVNGQVEIKDSLFHQAFSLVMLLAILFAGPAIGMIGIPGAPVSTLAALKALLFFSMPPEEMSRWIVREDFFNKWLDYLSKNNGSFNGVLMDKSYLMAGDSVIGVELEFQAISSKAVKELA